MEKILRDKFQRCEERKMQGSGKGLKGERTEARWTWMARVLDSTSAVDVFVLS